MNKQELFAMYSLNKDTVEVPNWGGDIHIQELSAMAMDKMRQYGDGDELKGAAMVLVYGVVDEGGERVFEEGDLDQILGMSVKDINKVAEAVLKLSGVGEEEVDPKA